MNIFDLPAIVVEKVRLEEILVMLRDNVNKSYMPHSKGTVPYNSKPSYVTTAVDQFPDYPLFSGGTFRDGDHGEYVCFDDFGTAADKKVIFFYLWIANFVIVINLQTEEAIITSNDYSGFVKWDSPEQTIPVMRDALRETIEIYT